MTPQDVVNGDDEQFALLLAGYSEALSAGRDANPASDPALSAELRQRLQRAADCLRRLRQFRLRFPVADAVTLVMEKDITLHDGIVGEQVGRFRILRTLGHGGGGIVFLAFDPDLHREVALKIPHMPALLAPDLRRRFLREARAAARLDHPNLVPVHEVGESSRVCFLVSAYCRGGSLAEWLRQRTTPVPVRQAAGLLAVLADAVQYVHEHGIFHRDIKPGNILLDGCEQIPQRAGSVSDGNTSVAGASGSLQAFTPRLTDFGLAKQLDSESSLTVDGTVLGTPSYMAPEQFECRPDKIGPRTDVYGLGAVLYEVLTGCPPFKGATDSETLDRVMVETPAPPRLLRADVPRDLETICLKCLEKWPEHRYGSAAELAGDLRRFLADEPVQARPPSGAERLGKWMRRHPRTMAAAGLACLAALILLLGSLWLHTMKRTHEANLAVTAKQHEEREQTIRQKERRFHQLHYAEDIAHASQHGSRRRLSELANQLHVYNSDDVRGFAWYYLSAQARILRWEARSSDGSLYCIAFSPDGTTCATGHEDGIIRLWDRASGRVEQMPPGHKLPIYALAYSRDGKYLVSGGGIYTKRSRESELLLWDVSTRKSRPLCLESLGAVNSVAFSDDDRTLVAVFAANTVRLWDMPAGTPRKTIHLDLIGVCVASPFTGSVYAVGHIDGSISVCDAADGRVLTRWRGHSHAVQALAFSQTNGLLISGGYDGEVRLWGRDKERPLARYRHNNEVWGVAFSPDGQMAASTGRDCIVKLWDVKEQRERFWFAVPTIMGRCVAFSPDGEDLAVGNQDGKLWMCDVSCAREATSWLGHSFGPVPREAWAITFSPDGKTLASAGDDNRICLWDPASGRLLNKIHGHQAMVSCIAFSPDGKLLASGSFDKQPNVKLWDAASGVEVASLPGHSKPVDALAFAPNGQMLATAGRDGVVRLWDMGTKKGDPILNGYTVESLAFSPDARTLALADEKESIFLWDVQGERILRKLPPHPQGHVAVAFSPDGQTLATGDKEGTVRFFDPATGQLRSSAQSHGHWVNCLAFAPDGKTLASAGFDKKVKLWHVATSRELLTLPEQKDRVRWLAFSPNGTMLATAGHDGVLTIYRADPSEPQP